MSLNVAACVCKVSNDARPEPLFRRPLLTLKLIACDTKAVLADNQVQDMPHASFSKWIHAQIGARRKLQRPVRLEFFKLHSQEAVLLRLDVEIVDDWCH